MVVRHRLVPPSRTSFPRPLAAGRTRTAGFTLVELMIVTAFIATLASITVPLYIGLTDRAAIAKAIADIKILESEIAMFEIEHTRLPVNLGEINRAGLKDSWGNPYEYLSFAAAGPGWKGAARKDHSLVPLNSTYDLYSKGKDGKSAPPLTAKASQDDIIRANDGGYIGLASAY